MTSHVAHLAHRSLRYLESGSGRALVLLHAFPLSADQWLPQLHRVPPGWRFVAPDNGVLTQVLRESPAKKIVELTERRYARPTVSRTFEGRDRFAPAAAWIAKGTQFAALGRAVSDIHRLDIPVAETTADTVRGVVLRVDRFGNLVTNIDRKTVERLGQSSAITIDANGTRISRLVATYAELPAEGVGALFGSTDHLELAAPSSSAADRLGLGRGAVVTVTRSNAAL